MRRRHMLPLFLVCCWVAALPACAATPPTVSPSPTPTPVLATSAAQIAGTWFGLKADGLYQRFNLDGTHQVATALEKLPGSPDAVNTFRFEGTRLLLAEVQTTGLPSCGSKAAIYEVHLLPNGNLRFVRIEDSCAPRARSTAQEHKPVR